MNDLVIKTDKLSKFIQNKPIVYRLNLEIPRGALFGLLGPNGAGKSTTLKLLTGRIKPTSGKAEINGLDPWKQRVALNRVMGYLPQNPVQYREKTVLDFMKYMARLYGYTREQAIAEAREALNRVGLGKFEEQIIGRLSGGEKQRLGFSNALLGDPDILVLDEPTASLDPEGRVYVMELIRDLARDQTKTIIVSSHILPEIQRMTNHIGIMSEGELLITGPIDELTDGIFDTEYELEVSDKEKMSQLLVDAGFPTKINDHKLVVDINGKDDYFWDSLPKLCAENNISLMSSKPVRDALEKLFLELVSKQKTRGEEN